MGKRKIGERLGMSKNTVKLYIEQFHQLKTTKEDLFKLLDSARNDLGQTLFLLIFILFSTPQGSPSGNY